MAEDDQTDKSQEPTIAGYLKRAGIYILLILLAFPFAVGANVVSGALKYLLGGCSIVSLIVGVVYYIRQRKYFISSYQKKDWKNIIITPVFS